VTMTAPCHAFLNDSSNIFVKNKGYNNIRESKKKKIILGDQCLNSIEVTRETGE